MIDDEALHAFEKSLDVEYDDPFEAVDACMAVKEFLLLIQQNKEKLVALFTDVELSDPDCKSLVSLITKATNLEGLSIDGVNISQTGSFTERKEVKERAKTNIVDVKQGLL